MKHTHLSSTLLALLGFSLVACQVTSTRSFTRPSALQTFSRSKAEPMKVFYGNLHSHTSYSDGILTPREAYRMAEGNGLDFMAVTEHNHSAAGGSDGISLTPKLYEDLKNTARKMTQAGKFVAMYGQEFSTISKGNHVNVFEADSIIRVPSGDFKQLYEKWLPAHPEVAFVQLNHPNFRRDLGLEDGQSFKPFHQEEEDFHMNALLKANPFEAQGSKQFNDYGYDDYDRDFKKLSKAANPYVRTLEILNGPGTKPKPLKKVEAYHEPDYFFYLNQGFRLAPSADQDNHYAHWGSLSPARTGVWAPSLTKKEIYGAIRERRVFASEDKNLSVLFKANGHYMGEAFKAGPQVKFEVTVRDQDEAQSPHLVQIYIDSVGGSVAKPLVQHTLKPGQTQFNFDWKMPKPGAYYAFVKVIQTNADGSFDDAWTSPVWLD